MSLVRFHAVHGDHVEISREGTEARLLQNGPAVGVVFSARPLTVNEKVCIQVTVPNAVESPFIFGFTNQNPLTLVNEEQRRNFSPYLVYKSRKTFQNGDTLHICAYSNGEVHYGLYREFSSRYFTGVDVTRLWLLVHLPNTVGSIVRFVEPRVCPQLLRGSLKNLRPLTFHRVRGESIFPSNGRDYFVIAISNSMTGHDRYVFSARPIEVNEKVSFYVSIFEAERAVIQIGFTNYDPALLTDSVKLEDENRYWLQTLVLLPTTTCIYFYVNSNKEVYVGGYEKLEYKLIPEINTSSPLWALFNILYDDVLIKFANAIYTSRQHNYGELKDYSYNYTRPVTRIRQLQDTGQVNDTEPRTSQLIQLHSRPTSPEPQSTSQESHPESSSSDSPSPSQEIQSESQNIEPNQSSNQTHEPGPSHHQDTFNTCIICYENPANTVFVACGHLSSCYDCARIWLSQTDKCPLCRALIQRILRVYKD